MSAFAYEVCQKSIGFAVVVLRRQKAQKLLLFYHFLSRASVWQTVLPEVLVLSYHYAAYIYFSLALFIIFSAILKYKARLVRYDIFLSITLFGIYHSRSSLTLSLLYRLSSYSPRYVHHSTLPNHLILSENRPRKPYRPNTIASHNTDFVSLVIVRPVLLSIAAILRTYHKSTCFAIAGAELCCMWGRS